MKIPDEALVSPDALLAFWLSPDGRTSLATAVGSMDRYNSIEQLPPGKRLKKGQEYAYLARLYFQGVPESNAIRPWGGLSRFYFECLEVFRFCRYEGFMRDDDLGKHLLSILQKVGIPSLRVFWKMLYCHERELQGCLIFERQQADGLDDGADIAPYYVSQANPYDSKDRAAVLAVITKLQSVLSAAAHTAIKSPVNAALELVEFSKALKVELEQLNQHFVEWLSLELVPGPGRKTQPFDEVDRAWLRAYWLRNTQKTSLPHLAEELEREIGQKVTSNHVSKRLSAITRDLESDPEISATWRFQRYWIDCVAESHWLGMDRVESSP